MNPNDATDSRSNVCIGRLNWRRNRRHTKTDQSKLLTLVIWIPLMLSSCQNRSIKSTNNYNSNFNKIDVMLNRSIKIMDTCNSDFNEIVVILKQINQNYELL